MSAATLLSRKLGVKTAVVSPAEVLDIKQVSRVIAELASPPLRFSVARDLAAAGYGVDDLRPLLLSTLPSGTEASDDAGLDKQRAALARLGPTVSWPGFPPATPPTRDPS